jgi:glutathione synthase
MLAWRDHSEKLSIAKYARFAAPTLVTRLAGQLQQFIDAHRDVVLKPLDGMGGESVFRVAERDPNRNVIIETLTRDGAKSVMAQRYIPEIRDGDKRILPMRGNCATLPCAHRSPADARHLPLAAPGSRSLSPARLKSRTRSGRARAPGCSSSADVIRTGSPNQRHQPTCFREITEQTGFDVAGMFLGRRRGARLLVQGDVGRARRIAIRRHYKKGHGRHPGPLPRRLR